MGFVVSHTQWEGRGFPVHYGSAEDGPKALYILGMAAATERHPRLLKGLFLVRTLEMTSAFLVSTEQKHIAFKFVFASRPLSQRLREEYRLLLSLTEKYYMYGPVFVVYRNK